MLLVSALSAALGAVAPMSPQAPVRLNASLAVLALLLAAGAWTRPRRAWSHVGLTTMIGALGLLAACTATPAGTAALGTSFTWAAAFGAFFLPRAAARAYGAAACAAFGAGLLLNPFAGAPHVWFLTSLTALVAVEAVGRLVRRLERAAVTDPLTGLLNRAGLQRRASAAFAAAERAGAPVSVAVVDLDGFKVVNDREGHDAGDRLLQALAEAWRKEIRADDVLARLGGDEFVLVLPDTSPRDADELLERLAAVSDSPWSCGVATGRPQAGLEVLLLDADRDLYAAKRRRREVVLLDEGQPTPT